MAHFNKRLDQTLSGSHLVDGHSTGSSGAVAAIDIRGPRRASAASARREAALNARRDEQTQVAPDPYAQTSHQYEEHAPSSVPSAPYSSGELPVAMSPHAYAQQTQHPVAVHAQMTPEAYASYVHAVHVANQQQAQLAQLAQMQIAASQLAAAAQPVNTTKRSARAAVEEQDENPREGRVKFLLFGLALGALVVILISGNTWSNLRTRLAYAMMPTPAAPAPVAAAPMPADPSTKIPEYEVARLPPAPPPVAAPVAAAPVAPAAPAAPKVVVAAAPKKQPMPTQVHMPAQPPPAAEPETVNDPAPPVPPGLDTALNMKAFGELGKAFKTESP